MIYDGCTRTCTVVLDGYDKKGEEQKFYVEEKTQEHDP